MPIPCFTIVCVCVAIRTGHSLVISGHGRYLYERVVGKVEAHMKAVAIQVCCRHTYQFPGNVIVIMSAPRTCLSRKRLFADWPFLCVLLYVAGKLQLPTPNFVSGLLVIGLYQAH